MNQIKLTPVINIQFLRAIAALAVMFYHYSLQYLVISVDHTNKFYDLFHSIGYAGVDFFFVISGYIMWITTQKATHSSTPAFAFKRLTRIYFGYWPYFLLALIILYFYPHLKPPEANLLGSFFLTEPKTTHLLIQVAWTLQFELYFYFLFALILCLPTQFKARLVWIMITAVVAYQLINRLFLTNSEHLGLFDFFLSPYCLEFFAGCLLGQFFQTKRIHYAPPLVIGSALLVFAVYYQTHVIHQSLISHQFVISRVLVFGLAAILIMAALIELEKRGRVFMKRFSLVLGGASYSIYLSHTIAIALTFALGWQTWVQNNSQSPGLWVGLFMLLTVIYSVIHYLIIEKPLMVFSNRFKNIIFTDRSVR